ncbi:membrane associated rhomboid family serine protease [Nonlabens dokdonensis]|jgi:membrane associated rhomboid family serine protease|uniref:Membrane associated rhomboid family serine protease n=2 Tax=Nonlabens dokdonensis TaxID=328515 RepID=A0ABX5PTR1_9FLAO|nr:rhomboid family intramembrane serine protease [Nonlabens dokdonensis]AGC77916.1 putative transmembrane rhomboid family protein [Nonlabens dokdonensis DSW-6]PZX36652.1 membrane associated rhomboid family serine protease [Nonlabens dokdonensis]
MNVWDQFKAKYAVFDTSGKLITVIFATTLLGWILSYAYAPAYLQIVLPNGFLPALLQPWSWVSYGFLHDGLFHFIGNAFGIHIAGRYILNIFRGRQFLTLFFLGVLAGAISFVVATGLLPDFFRGNLLLGASAGVFALIFFACTYFPESEFRLIFVNIKLKYFAYFFLASNLVMVALQVNTGGSLAHLAGAAVGYYAATRMRSGIDVLEGFSKTGDYIVNLFKSSPKKPKSQRKAKMKTVYKGKTSQTKASKVAATDQAKIDAILDKISSSGYESLSKAEKDYLFKAGNDK